MLVISIDQVCSKQQKPWKKYNFVEKNNTKTAICGPWPRLIILIAPAGAGAGAGAPVVPHLESRKSGPYTSVPGTQHFP